MFFRSYHTYLKSISSLWTRTVTLTVISTHVLTFVFGSFYGAMHKAIHSHWGYLSKQYRQDPSSDGVGYIYRTLNMILI